MDRISGFFLILLTRTFCSSHLLNPNIPFEIDISKFKLPEPFYPENDRDAIPIYNEIRESQVPGINVKNYELPDASLPIGSNVIPQSEHKPKKLPEEDLEKILLSSLLNPLREYKKTNFRRRFQFTPYEPNVEDMSEKTFYSQPPNTLDENVYLSKKDKQVMALKKKILGDLILLRMLEGGGEEFEYHKYLYA